MPAMIRASMIRMHIFHPDVIHYDKITRGSETNLPSPGERALRPHYFGANLLRPGTIS